MKQLLIVTILLFLFFSPAKAGKMSPDEYISTHTSIAVFEMERSGIPASITMAQGIIESCWGGSELATKYKNHFGIKCSNAWDGIHTYQVDDDYDENGNLIESCFRGYYTVEESFKDHSNFLMRGERYAKLFELEKGDFAGWALGLKECGYATDPEYAQKLINTINKYRLFELDYAHSTQEITHHVPVEMPEVFYLPEDYRPGQYDDLIAEAPVKMAAKVGQVQSAPTYDLGTLKGTFEDRRTACPVRRTDKDEEKQSHEMKFIADRQPGNVVQLSSQPRTKVMRRN